MGGRRLSEGQGVFGDGQLLGSDGRVSVEEAYPDTTLGGLNGAEPPVDQDPIHLVLKHVDFSFWSRPGGGSMSDSFAGEKSSAWREQTGRRSEAQARRMSADNGASPCEAPLSGRQTVMSEYLFRPFPEISFCTPIWCCPPLSVCGGAGAQLATGIDAEGELCLKERRSGMALIPAVSFQVFAEVRQPGRLASVT